MNQKFEFIGCFFYTFGFADYEKRQNPPDQKSKNASKPKKNSRKRKKTESLEGNKFKFLGEIENGVSKIPYV